MVHQPYTIDNAFCSVANKQLLHRSFEMGETTSKSTPPPPAMVKEEKGNGDVTESGFKVVPTPMKEDEKEKKALNDDLAPSKDAKKCEEKTETEPPLLPSSLSSPVIRYSKEKLMELSEVELAKVAPACEDDRWFWRRNKQRRSADRTDRRVGSGRLSGGSDKWSTMNGSGNYRGKNVNFATENNNYLGHKNEPLQVNYFNPVNKDHRRLLHEEDKEPEWSKSGPTSRFDIIDLHGFEDGRHSTGNLTSTFGLGPGPIGKKSASVEDNKENSSNNTNQPFVFDEFLGPEPIGNFFSYYGNPNNTLNQDGSRFKRWFKRDSPAKKINQSNQQQRNLGEQIKRDQASALLKILHGRNVSAGNSTPPAVQPSQTPFKNLSQMPCVDELESQLRQAQANNPLATNALSAQAMLAQLNYNKTLLAGKNFADIVNVVSQAQQHRLAANQLLQAQQNQLTKFIEAQQQLQKMHPTLNLNVQAYNSPEFWQMIQARQQAYYEQYNAQQQQQQHKMAQNACSGGGGGGCGDKKGKRVHFNCSKTTSEKLAPFFNAKLVAQAQPTDKLPADKVINVDEIERNVKASAAVKN